MANPYLDKYLEKVNEAGAFSKNAQAGIDQGVSDLKSKYNFDAKVAELEDANGQVLETRKALKNLNKNVQDRTAGRSITQAQLSRIQAAERDPLTRQLGDQSESAGLASGNVSNISKLIDGYRSDRRNSNADYLQGLGTEASGLWKGYEAFENDEEKKYRTSRDAIGDSYNSSLLDLQRLGLAGGSAGALGAAPTTGDPADSSDPNVSFDSVNDQKSGLQGGFDFLGRYGNYLRYGVGNSPEEKFYKEANRINQGAQVNFKQPLNQIQKNGRMYALYPEMGGNRDKNGNLITVLYDVTDANSGKIKMLGKQTDGKAIYDQMKKAEQGAAKNVASFAGNTVSGIQKLLKKK
jgi:hypothetical protein